MVLLCIGVQSFRKPYLELDVGQFTLNDFHCDSTEVTLLDCPHDNLTKLTYMYSQQNLYNCTGAGVACPYYNLLKNVSMTFMNTSNCPLHYVWISWELRSTMLYQPSSFNIECLNHDQPHSINISVDNKTFTVQLGCLPSAAYYTCCVRAMSDSNILLDEICRVPNKTSTDDLFTGGASHDLDNRTSIIIGGVLGFIIVVLLTALAICGGALLFLLRSISLILKR